MRLLPSLRQKKRYIVFEAQSSGKLSCSELQHEVETALLAFLGEWGVAQAAPQFLPETWIAEKQRFVIRVNHTQVDLVKAALILIKSIKKEPVILRSITTSGTLKKVKVRGG